MSTAFFIDVPIELPVSETPGKVSKTQTLKHSYSFINRLDHQAKAVNSSPATNFTIVITFI